MLFFFQCFECGSEIIWFRIFYFTMIGHFHHKIYRFHRSKGQRIETVSIAVQLTMKEKWMFMIDKLIKSRNISRPPAPLLLEHCICNVNAVHRTTCRLIHPTTFNAMKSVDMLSNFIFHVLVGLDHIQEVSVSAYITHVENFEPPFGTAIYRIGGTDTWYNTNTVEWWLLFLHDFICSRESVLFLHVLYILFMDVKCIPWIHSCGMPVHEQALIQSRGKSIYFVNTYMYII